MRTIRRSALVGAALVFPVLALLYRPTPAHGAVHEEVVTSTNYQYTVAAGGTMDEFNTATCGHAGHGGYACPYQPNVLFEIANVGTANVANPRVVIGGRRVWFSQADIANEVFAGASTARDKTFALWNWCRANLSGGQTYGTPLWGDTQSIVRFMNCFGTGACGTYHRVMPLIGVWGGVETYEGCQASCSHATQKERYDGAFRYFDCMLPHGGPFPPQGYFCLGLDNENVVGTAEIANDHYLSDRVGTSPGFFWMTSLFGGPGESYNQVSNWTDPRTMNLTLRPGEALQHTWRMTTPLWNGQQPENGANANGQVHFEPVLSSAGVAYAAETASNLAYTTLEDRPAVAVSGNSTTARLGYAMDCPYVFIGGRMGMRVSVPGGAAAGCVRLLIRFEGGAWTAVWSSSTGDIQDVEVDFGNRPEFREPNFTHRFHVQLELTSGVGITPTVAGWWIDGVFQSYALSLPALAAGDNTVVYSDQSGSRQVRVRHEWQPSDPVPAPAAPASPVHPPDGGEAGFNDLFAWEPAVAAPAHPVDRYEIYVSARADLKWPVVTSLEHVTDDATASLFLPSPDVLIDGRTYYWRVRARTADGLWGRWSGPWSFTARGPGRPTNVAANVDAAQGTVVLTWAPPAAGRPPVRYEVYGDTQHGFTPLREPKTQCSLDCAGWSRTFSPNLVGSTAGLSMDLTGRDEAYYRVCAVDADGNRSVASTYVGVRTPLLAPAAPPAAEIYQPFEFTVRCTRRGGNYVFTLSHGMVLQDADTIRFALASAPPWMDIDYESGVLSGTPTGVGAFPFTVQVTDGRGGSNARTYTLQVNGDPGAPSPTPRPTSTPTPYSGSVCLGSGRDGAVDVQASVTWNQPRARVVSMAGNQLTLSSPAGEGAFAPGDELLVIQMMQADETAVGTNEFAYVSSYAPPALALTQPLAKAFGLGTGDRVQVVRVPHFTTFRVRQGVTVAVPSWDGTTGGVAALRATGQVLVQGTIGATGCGYRGAGGGQGEGYPGGGSGSPAANGNGGGQGQSNGYCSGGGGGHGAAGSTGATGGSGSAGAGGESLGTADLTRLTMGGGGGSGSGPQFNCCCGGSGGGIIAVAAGSIVVEGSIQASGTNGGGSGGCGGPGPDWRSGGPGGGAGGSIALEAHASMALGSSLVLAQGGAGGSGSNGGPAGGRGAEGRIAVRCEGALTGATGPSYGSLWSLCSDLTPPPTPTQTPYLSPTPYTGDACIGTGADGAFYVSSSTTWNPPRARVLDLPSSTTLRLAALAGAGTFQAGDEVLIVQMYHADPGRVGVYEFARVQSWTAPDLLLAGGLANAFSASGGGQVQVVRVPNHTSITVAAGATLSAPAWNGAEGGIIALRATGKVTVDGAISATRGGYAGAGGGQGDGCAGPGGAGSPLANGNGAGQGQASGYCSGGGGGHASAGAAGSCSAAGTAGAGGLALGIANLSRLTMGGGGGTGLGPQYNCCCAGSGGGIAVIVAGEIDVNGKIESNGGDGGGTGGCGGPGPDWKSGGVGGGAGGSIALQAHAALDLGTGWVTAWGGAGTAGTAGGPSGGNGSEGRIAVACDGDTNGWTSPAAADLVSLCPPAAQSTPTPPPNGNTLVETR